MRKLIVATVLLLASVPSAAAPATNAVPAASVLGVSPAQLEAGYWTRRLHGKPRTVLGPQAIAAQNARLMHSDKSVLDVEAMPATISGTQVTDWIKGLSSLPKATAWDEHGIALDKSALDQLSRSIAIETVPASQPARFGLVTRRASLRTFPTLMRVFSEQGNTDIDRFQESALFPGTPVLIVHESQDRQWLFVVSQTYAAWIEKDKLAEGPKATVFGYTRKRPSLVITGAAERTVFTPELPAVSGLQLDMGLRLPVLADWPADKPVNGQHALAGRVIELPVREADGSLRLVPALLPRSADVANDYLPLTRENLLRQAFKFLGERYGWGHGYDARDCSGFVSEVYRSFGVQLPRNTRDQGVSPALNRLTFTDTSDRAFRMAAARALRVGDLVYIPGHVMMVIGFDQGQPYVIHDTTGTSVRDAQGQLARVVLNGVSVTPLLPLMANAEHSYIDRMYSIQRIRP